MQLALGVKCGSASATGLLPGAHRIIGTQIYGLTYVLAILGLVQYEKKYTTQIGKGERSKGHLRFR